MRLTSANLIELARQARAHVYGVEFPPLTVEELAERRRGLPIPRMASSWLHVFGPGTGPKATGYDVIYSLGLQDYEAQGPVSYGPSDTVRTIEAQLAEELRRHPPEAGFDLVAVLHERPAEGDERLRHAAQVDGDARACLRRASNMLP